MKKVSSFHISIIIILLAFARSDKILKDYGNGNQGAGVNDEVKGVNNTWVGDNNSIQGNINKVVGDSNKIQGSNNIVQGSNNVIGDISPQQIQRLQNQMFASMQDRFKGLFNFNSIPAANKEPIDQQKKQQQNSAPNSLPSNEQKHAQAINKIISASNKNVEENTSHLLQPSTQIIKQTQQQGSIERDEPLEQQAKIQSKHILVFRSYGSQNGNADYQPIFYLQDEMGQQNSQLCQRWNYCYPDTRSMRWSFSSIYPSFPFSYE